MMPISPVASQPATATPSRLLDARHRKALTRYARTLLRRSEHDAEDVVQDVLIRAHAALLAGNVPDDPRPWLYRLTRNRAIDEVRRARWGDEALDADARRGAATARGPDAVLRRKETLRRLVDDLADLPGAPAHGAARPRARRPERRGGRRAARRQRPGGADARDAGAREPHQGARRARRRPRGHPRRAARRARARRAPERARAAPRPRVRRLPRLPARDPPPVQAAAGAEPGARAAAARGPREAGRAAAAARPPWPRAPPRSSSPRRAACSCCRATPRRPATRRRSSSRASTPLAGKPVTTADPVPSGTAVVTVRVRVPAGAPADNERRSVTLACPAGHEGRRHAGSRAALPAELRPVGRDDHRLLHPWPDRLRPCAAAALLRRDGRPPVPAPRRQRLDRRRPPPAARGRAPGPRLRGQGLPLPLARARTFAGTVFRGQPLSIQRLQRVGALGPRRHRRAHAGWMRVAALCR